MLLSLQPRKILILWQRMTKGLICTPMSAELAAKLNFPQMVSENSDNHETAFTVSIDHVDTTPVYRQQNVHIR